MAMRFAPLGFLVDALVSGCEDFGEIAEVKTLDEGECDGAAIGFGPAAQPANKFLNHDDTFTFSVLAQADVRVARKTPAYRTGSPRPTSCPRILRGTKTQPPQRDA
jgi:hypothetical protein